MEGLSDEAFYPWESRIKNRLKSVNHTFAHERADIKLAYFQSAVSRANVDGFKKFKIMVVRFDVMMENDEKRH